MGKLSSFKRLKKALANLPMRKRKRVLARWEKWWTRKCKTLFDRMGYNGEIRGE